MKEQGERFDGWRKSIVKLVEMDEKITLSEQMEEENVGPVILINKFNVKPEEVDQLLTCLWSKALYWWKNWIPEITSYTTITNGTLLNNNVCGNVMAL
jgi:hypothetical protein